MRLAGPFCCMLLLHTAGSPHKIGQVSWKYMKTCTVQTREWCKMWQLSVPDSEHGRQLSVPDSEYGNHRSGPFQGFGGFSQRCARLFVLGIVIVLDRQRIRADGYRRCRRFARKSPGGGHHSNVETSMCVCLPWRYPTSGKYSRDWSEI